VLHPLEVASLLYYAGAPDHLIAAGALHDVVDKTAISAAELRECFGTFFVDFSNADLLAPDRIGDTALRASFQVAAGASPYATYACVDTWLTDFREDLPKIDVTLIVHGTADRILPFEPTAARLPDDQLIAELTVVEVPDGPHNLARTFPDEANAALPGFLSGEQLNPTTAAGAVAAG